MNQSDVLVECANCGCSVPESEALEGWEMFLKPDDLAPVPLCPFCARWPEFASQKKILEHYGLVVIGVADWRSVKMIHANDGKQTLCFDVREVTNESVAVHIREHRQKFMKGK